MSAMFPNANGHMCLQHAKGLWNRRISNHGFSREITNMQECLAFMPKWTRHISTDLVLEKFRSAGQDRLVHYLLEENSAGTLKLVDGFWDCMWKSSFEDVAAKWLHGHQQPAKGTTYVKNGIGVCHRPHETSWA